MKKIIPLLLAVIVYASVMLAYASPAPADDAASMIDKKPAKKKKGEIKEVVFSVNLHCENCVKKVQENIAFERGVKDLHVCLADQIVAIKYDSAKTSEATLKAAIEKLGYAVNGTVESGHESEHHHHAH